MKKGQAVSHGPPVLAHSGESMAPAAVSRASPMPQQEGAAQRRRKPLARGRPMPHGPQVRLRQ